MTQTRSHNDHWQPKEADFEKMENELGNPALCY